MRATNAARERGRSQVPFKMAHLVPSSHSTHISKQRQNFVPDANFSFVGLWRAPVRWHGYRQNMKLWWCCTENWKPESSLKFLPSCHQKDIFQYQSPAEKERAILLAVLLSLHFQKQINRPKRIRKAQPESFGLDLCSTNSCPSRIPPNPVRFSHPQARAFSLNALVNG